MKPLRWTVFLLVCVVVQAQGQAADPPLARREFESRIVELDRRFTQRFELNDRAVVAALATLNSRLDGMNEFRNTLRDQAGTFVPRAEWDIRFGSLEQQVKALELYRENAQGRAQQTVLLTAAFFTVLQVVMAIFFWKWQGKW